jgi:hypothetical protein
MASLLYGPACCWLVAWLLFRRFVPAQNPLETKSRVRCSVRVRRNAPYCISNIVRNQQRTVLILGKSHRRTEQCFLVGRIESGNDSFRFPDWLALLERDVHHFVTA